MAATFGKNFGQLVRKSRKSKNPPWTGQDLAAAVEQLGKGYNASESEISRLETGKINAPDEQTVRKYSEALEIDQTEIEACFPIAAWQRYPGNFIPSPPKLVFGQVTAIDAIKAFIKDKTAVSLLVHGMGGVGKTALTASALNQQPKSFHCFCVDIRGYDNTVTPEAGLKSALTKLIMRYGEPLAELPNSLHELGRLWLEVSRSVDELIIFDNVSDSEHVKSLAPNSIKKYLVTSRRQLLGFEQYTSIEPLPAEIGANLANSILRSTRSKNSTADLAASIAEYCEGLPLAINVAAGAIACTPGINTDLFLEQLSQSRKKFPLSDDWEDAVIQRLLLSVKQLSPKQRAIWITFGIFPGSFSVDAAAGINPSADIQSCLANFLRRHLIRLEDWQSTPSQRYVLHDLLRAVALRELDALTRNEALGLAERFSSYFAELVQNLHNHIIGFDYRTASNSLLVEIDNIRAAFEESLKLDDEEATSRVASLACDQTVLQQMPLDDQCLWVDQAYEKLKNSENQLGANRFVEVILEVQLTRAQVRRRLARYEEAKNIMMDVVEDERLSSNRQLMSRCWVELSNVLQNIPDNETEHIRAFIKGLKVLTKAE